MKKIDHNNIHNTRASWLLMPPPRTHTISPTSFIRLDEALWRLKWNTYLYGYCGVTYKKMTINELETKIMNVLKLEDLLDDNNYIKYTHDVWNSHIANNICIKVLEYIEKERKQKLRNKVRGLLKCTYILRKLHQDAIERLYRPDSKYIHNIIATRYKSYEEKNINPNKSCTQ